MDEAADLLVLKLFNHLVVIIKHQNLNFIQHVSPAILFLRAFRFLFDKLPQFGAAFLASKTFRGVVKASIVGISRRKIHTFPP